MGVERWSKVKKPLQIMKVEMVPITDVVSHEDVIEEEIEDFIKSLKTKGIFYRPILLDSNSMVVLDGHHRVEGLRRMGAKKVPSIMLDYNSDDIKIFTWYPVIWGHREDIISELGHIAKIESLETRAAILKVDQKEAIFCVLPEVDGMAAVAYGDERLIFEIGDRFELEYVDTLDFIDKLKGDRGVILYRRSPTKREVVDRALRGEKFPPKTTRHYLPFRYQDIRIKLSHLF